MWDKQISAETKTKIFKTIVRSIMTYGPDVWTTNKHITKINDSRDGPVSYTHLDVYKRQCK